MWDMVRALRDTGVTIILTTHYIEEAEQMADRVGVISQGKLILVEEKAELMRKLGRKQLTLQLQKPLESIPESLDAFGLELSPDGCELTYTYDTQGSAPASRACSRRWRRRTSGSRTCTRRRVRWKRFSSTGEHAVMNFHAVRAIYMFEMARTGRTLCRASSRR